MTLYSYTNYTTLKQRRDVSGEIGSEPTLFEGIISIFP
jgi:hypothetical protein